MRTVTGNIILPENAPSVKAGLVLIEVRDVSVADAPSKVVEEQRLTNIMLNPNGNIAFKLQVPEVASNRTLVIRAHVSLDGSGKVKSGDLLTTASYPVPTTGIPPILEIPIVRV